jgi:hypothetical protein
MRQADTFAFFPTCSTELGGIELHQCHKDAEDQSGNASDSGSTVRIQEPLSPAADRSCRYSEWNGPKQGETHDPDIGGEKPPYDLDQELAQQPGDQAPG